MHFAAYYHFVFDVIGFAVAAVLFRRELRRAPSRLQIQEQNGYWISLVVGAVSGAYLAGSMNLSLSGLFRIGHSIAGALAGGIAGVEIYKHKQGVRKSTGSVFVVSLMAGIIIGRLGCFFSGLADETYGTPTSSIFGLDFGDGVARHPVQLYESFSLLIGLLALHTWRRDGKRFQEIGFYLFTLFYACQRFCWEFLKPYPKLFLELNLFHLICILLAIYSLTMMRLANAGRT